MSNHSFAGCPFYKDDIAKVLHAWYPNTSFNEFMRKSIRQLRAIYANTVEKPAAMSRTLRNIRKKEGVMKREEGRKSVS